MQTVVVIGLMIGSGVAGAFLTRLFLKSDRQVTPVSRVADLPPLDESKPGSVAVLNIDDLAGLNSADGFDTGDRLLDRIEDALRRALPGTLDLERLENGRFVVWLPEANLDKAAETVERLRATASTAYVTGNSGIACRTLSAGLVTTDVEQARGRAVLHADAAAARAKANGGNRLELVRGSISAPAGPSAAEVREAILTGALSFYVQPIIDLTTGKTAGVEALLRWNLPDGKVVGPASFIDRLERMTDLDGRVLADLVEAAATPILALSEDMFFTINITATVLDGAGHSDCAWLWEVLRRLPPERIVTEIVETAIIAQPERAADLVARLRAKGVRVALDDFGTGLSNLDRLRQMPVDFLKVDRAFIQGLSHGSREDTILRNIARLAADLGMEIISEGVETAEQAQAISDLGVRYAQGFFYGRPGPVDEWSPRLQDALHRPLPGLSGQGTEAHRPGCSRG
ncbi:GGDEF domain-containing phosphodiesterase [Jannaschia sp. 2305UL9-9]|uniref:GGDEF domain-containing phosphodiesterase n=1 Tax=Jannaschia sp. 2305UL9-9 TaxID=3121638 RepID=UPI003528AB40